MRISDWSSDVCSSDLFYTFKIGNRGSLGGVIDAIDVDRDGVFSPRTIRRRAHSPQEGGTQANTAAIGESRRYPGEVDSAGDPCRFQLSLAKRLNGDRNFLEVLIRSEEHTSELQSLMRNSYAVFCLKQKTHK